MECTIFKNRTRPCFVRTMTQAEQSSTIFVKKKYIFWFGGFWMRAFFREVGDKRVTWTAGFVELHGHELCPAVWFSVKRKLSHLRPTGTTESDGQKNAYGSLKKAIICSAVAHQQTFFFSFFTAKPSATQSLTTYCCSTVFSFCFVFLNLKFAKWKSHRFVQTQALHSKTRCISPHPVNDQQKTLNKLKWGKEIKNEG